MKHDLKTVQPFFNDVWNGLKNFEVRRNDRDYKLGDFLNLKEYDPITETFKSRSITKKIKYILDDPQYVKEGYVILGME